MAPRAILPMLPLVAMGGGCASALVEDRVEVAHVEQRWLPRIVDGRSSIDDLVARLGAPTMTFDGGRLNGWILQLHEDGVRAQLAQDGTIPGPRDLGSGRARTQRRENIDRDGELRTVSAADLRERAVWPVRREAEFHLVVVQTGGLVERHVLRRVLP